MKLTPICVDFETFWSQTHSLSKLIPIDYVMHPDTEIIYCAMKIGGLPAVCAEGEAEIRELLAQVEWDSALAYGHNMSEFDAMILAWRFGMRPRMWGCTLAMARPIHAKTTGLSLGALVKHYGLGVKDNTALVNTRGRHLAELTAAERAAMRKYNIEDVEQTARLFAKLQPHVPSGEMRIIDLTIRMLVEPAFLLDAHLVEQTLAEERVRKAAALNAVRDMLGVATVDEARSLLASQPKFAEFLRQCGVEPPMKPSPTNPEKLTYALAKSDEAFLALREHEDTRVAIAAETRLDVKSTLLERRLERFIVAGERCHGRMPIALRYAGADTTLRWSGTMKLNQQNLPRVARDKEGNVVPKLTNALRMSLVAPKGKLIVAADKAGIELRINMFLWKVPYAMELFRAAPDKADLYRYFASHELYHVDEPAVTKAQRQVGKVSHLGLGFGAGKKTFRQVARLMGGVDMDASESESVVNTYRAAHPEIVEGWRTCHAALSAIYTGDEMDIDPWGLCHTSAEGIVTPCGIIRYPALRQEMDPETGRAEWWYGTGKHRARIYAGKVTENIVQHLARGIMAEDILNIRKQTGYAPALIVHDEWVGAADEAAAPGLLYDVLGIMRTPPSWWPELVVWAEGDLAPRYGEAK